MQIKILSVSSRDGGACVAISLLISDGAHSEKKELILLSSQYAKLSVAKNDLIACDQLDDIECAANICSAYRKGMQILNFGACSRRRMIFKLRQKGIDAEAAEAAADMLVEQKYINEEQDAHREAEKCLAKHWGMSRITAHLYEKGFEREAVMSACEKISDFDFAESCAEYMTRHRLTVPSDPQQSKKLFAKLARMGFSSSEIKEAFLLVKKSNK